MITSTISRSYSGTIHFVKGKTSSTIGGTQNTISKIYSGIRGGIRVTISGTTRLLRRIRSDASGSVNGIVNDVKVTIGKSGPKDRLNSDMDMSIRGSFARIRFVITNRINVITSTISRTYSGITHFVKGTISSTITRAQNASSKIYSGVTGSVRSKISNTIGFFGKIRSGTSEKVSGTITDVKIITGVGNSTESSSRKSGLKDGSSGGVNISVGGDFDLTGGSSSVNSKQSNNSRQ